MEEAMITAIVFFGVYSIFKLISEHFLKRKVIASGHIDKAGILLPAKDDSAESNRYPSLKWGLVAFLGGLGLIVVELVRANYPELITWRNSVLAIGVELMFISLGFLIYFFIVTIKKK